MKITTEQEKILDQLICERLRDNPESSSLIQTFESKKGNLIVDYLKQYGLEEDKQGSTAFYIVRTQDNQVLMFFSLKCGELFDPLIDEEELETGLEEYLILLQALSNVDPDTEKQKAALQKLKALSNAKGTNVIETLNKILEDTSLKINKLDWLKKEKSAEPNENISRVSQTYPGVELVHFCTNDNAKEMWKSYNFLHSMGEVIFWKFIAPLFFEVQNIVGCEYAFLFAADMSEDGTLLNYYNESLKFVADEEIGTNKPYYDFLCSFMCQKLSSLRDNQKWYFENFNPDEQDEIV